MVWLLSTRSLAPGRSGCNDINPTIPAIGRRPPEATIGSWMVLSDGEVISVPLMATDTDDALLDREAITHLRRGRPADHREGAAAFLEKREPQCQGRRAP